jgi:hypothetical protein
MIIPACHYYEPESMTRQSWQEWTFFVLSSNKIYCSIIFADRIESTKFIKCFYKVKYENSFTETEARFLPKAPTQNSRRLPNADLTTGINTDSFAFLAFRVATFRTRFQFFPHRSNGALAQSSVTDIGHYIRRPTRKLCKCKWWRNFKLYSTCRRTAPLLWVTQFNIHV